MHALSYLVPVEIVNVVFGLFRACGSRSIPGYNAQMTRKIRKNPMHGQHLFGTTKGKILVLLCHDRHTVAELAQDLGVTDNAVRAQLERMMRDGLVLEAGSRRGVRKPHVEYELTPNARRLFPRAYEPLLQSLVDALSDRLAPKMFRELLIEAGLRFLRKHIGELRGRSARQRLVEVLKQLNGSNLGIELAEESGETLVRSCSCPVATVTASHPEICGLLAGVMGSVLNANVRERCEKGDSPRCCFEVSQARQRSKSSGA